MSRVSTQLPAPIAILPSSRLKDTKVLMNDTTRTREWGLWASDPVFSNATDYTLHRVRDVDIGRLDLLSYQYYGTVEYAWMIADANSFRNPFSDMHVGDLIRIPSAQVAESYSRRRGRS